MTRLQDNLNAEAEFIAAVVAEEEVMELLDRDTEVEEARMNYLSVREHFGPNSDEAAIACRIWTDIQSMDDSYSPEAQDRIIRQIYAKHGITL